MTPAAYYNEIDPYCAEWLRNLILLGEIADGEVDTRSIEDVRPEELGGFTQCHFFAGIGVWSAALRAAGWPDDRPVWTGSCPCQPFSAAGKGEGFADERHLWPAWHHLIRISRPDCILGEQVASKDGLTWLDLVHDDLEGEGYTVAAIDTCAAGFGAPHIRQRLYFMADAANQRQHWRRPSEAGNGQHTPRLESERLCDADGLGDASGTGLAQRVGITGIPGLAPGGNSGQASVGTGLYAGGVADDARGGRREERADTAGLAVGDRAQGLAAGLVDGSRDLRAGPTKGFWRDADWLFCWDGKWRPVEPGTFPLAYGTSSRVGRLRAYGNAINLAQAQGFIEAVMKCRP